MEAAKQEAGHLQEAQLSAQMQLQQYVVDIQALERNCDTLTRELHAAKQEAEDLARDRNRVLEQMQSAQVRACLSPGMYVCSQKLHSRPTSAAFDFARDRNRVLDQMQSAQVRAGLSSVCSQRMHHLADQAF